MGTVPPVSILRQKVQSPLIDPDKGNHRNKHMSLIRNLTGGRGGGSTPN